MKILSLLIACLIIYLLVRFNKVVIEKIMGKFFGSGAAFKYRIGFTGDVKGCEKQAREVVEAAISMFIKIGGNPSSTQIVLKTPSKKGLIDIIRPIAESHGLQIVGIHFVPGNIDTRRKHEIFDKEIDVSSYKMPGDESSTFLKNIDQLIYLSAKSNDEIALKEFDDYTGPKMKYDLNRPEYMKAYDARNF